MDEENIWAASLEVYIRNWKWVLGYICMANGLACLERFININSGGSAVVGVLMSTFLAIPVHITILTQLDSDQIRSWMRERPNAFFAFFRRCILIGLLGAVAPFIVGIMLLFRGVHPSIALLIGLLVWIFCGVGAFAKWGTMLPAVIVDDDQTLSAAGKRGSKVFNYAFPRLFMSFALISIVPIAVAMLISSKLGADIGNLGPSLTFVAFGAMVGAYQIVMTSVVLSRSYLRATTMQSARLRSR